MLVFKEALALRESGVMLMAVTAWGWSLSGLSFGRFMVGPNRDTFW